MVRHHIYRTRTDRDRWKARRRNGILRRQLHKINVKNRERFGVFGNQYTLLTDAFGAHGMARLRKAARAVAVAPHASVGPPSR